MKSALVALAFILACQNPLDYWADGAIRIDPPAVYRELWHELEACSGLEGDFDSVRWYLAPEGVFSEGLWAGGLWDGNGNKIFLTPPYKDDPHTIRHEEMHALLQSGQHPPLYFNGLCGNLMAP